MSGRFLGPAVPGADEHAPRTYALTGLEIVPPIADDERLVEGDAQVRRCSLQESGLRLAAVARLAIGLDHGLGVVRAIVERIDLRPARGQPFGNVAMGLSDECLLENPAGTARLIGHNHDRQDGSIQQSDGIDAVRKEHEALETIEVTCFLNEGAVTVEKHSSPGHFIGAAPAAPRWSRRPDRTKCVSYSDGRSGSHAACRAGRTLSEG